MESCVESHSREKDREKSLFEGKLRQQEVVGQKHAKTVIYSQSSVPTVNI